MPRTHTRGFYLTRLAVFSLLVTGLTVYVVKRYSPVGVPERSSVSTVNHRSQADRADDNATPHALERSSAAIQKVVNEAYGKLPMSFEVNEGQLDRRVKYSARGDGYKLFLTSDEAILTLRQAGTAGAAGERIPNRSVESKRLHAESKKTVLRMKLVGARRTPQVEGIDALAGKSNYFIGNDPAKWRTNVSHYARVQYRNVYPGVNLVYYGRQRQLEYDFVVAPGADVRAIKLAYHGAQDVYVHADGDLILTTGGGELRQHKPLIYQEVDGQRKEIAGHYTINEKREVGFEVAAYDNGRPLVIDPVLSYSTYLGGNKDDMGLGIAVDSAGNAYVTGFTRSENFPTANSRTPGNDFNDAFVTKLNAAGSALIYSTYLGGGNNEQGNGIAVDSAGNAYVTGITRSADFPTASALQGALGGSNGGNDAFFTKLSPTGSTLVYSTYLGGSGSEFGYAIALDSAGNAYAVGRTDSTDFPTANALQPAFGGYHFGGDAYVSKLDSSGKAFVYSTFLGGNSYDEGLAVAVDSSGSAYVTGATHSTNFPMVNPFQPQITGGGCASSNGAIAQCFDAFVSKLKPDGSALLYSTYLGGDGGESGTAIAVDSSGHAYVSGSTNAANFPTVNPFQSHLTSSGSFIPASDAFVTKLNPDGSTLAYSTYLGGAGSGETGMGIAVDSSGNVYLTGSTSSRSFPTVDSLKLADGSGDAFITKLNAEGTALVYSTLLGGGNHDSGNAIALDVVGNAYVTGYTLGSFPTEKAFQPFFGGGNPNFNEGDGFIAKIGNNNIPQPTILSISAVRPDKGGNNGFSTITVFGSNFVDGASVKLVSANASDITATTVHVSADSTIARARFDLRGQPSGLRNVSLMNHDGTSVTRAGAFTIEQGGVPNLWLDVIGSESFRPGVPRTYYIAFGNRGNTDAMLVPIFISIPKSVDYELGFNFVKTPQPVADSNFDFDQIPAHYETATEKIIPLIIAVIPAGSSDFLRIRLTGAGEAVQLNVYGGKPRYYAPILFQIARSANQQDDDFEDQSDGEKFVNCMWTLGTRSYSCLKGFAPTRGCEEAAKSYMRELAQQSVTLTGDAALGLFTPSSGVISLTQATAGQVVLYGACEGLERTGQGAVIIGAVNCGLGAGDIASSCFGFDPFDKISKLLIPIFSHDPNDKFGSVGAGSGHYLAAEEPLRYSVLFENDASATAPAQSVVVTDQLDASKLDFDTFSLGPISFGKDKEIIPPSNLSEYKTDVDLRPSKNLIVRVEAKLDKASGLLTWRFTSLDPATGLLTEDPTAGFLPPNKNAPEGEGQVLFTVHPKKEVATGTEIRNKARIVFDTNAPIDTPEWLNTIDNSKPLSAVLPLPASSNSARFAVSWSGSDTGSGIRSYTIFVSEDGAPFSEWLRDTTLTSGTFIGRPGHTYAFHSVARDAAGNEETLHATADATITTAPLVLQFDAANYSVSENAGGVQINVMRTGNTADTATVDYRTTDTDTFSVSCADTTNNNSGAFARCDFATTVGTLSFVAGELSKTITVPIIDDGHDEGAETFQLQLTNAAGAGTTLGVLSLATVTILDTDEAGARNPIITVSPADYPFFVRQQYLDFLSRSPEPSEPWTAVMNRCPNVHTPPSTVTDCDRIAVSGAFFGSPEFRLKGFYVFRFYKLAFNRLPEYGEIVADMSFVAGATEAEVYARKAQLATAFVAQPEFTKAYGTKTNAEYVTALLTRYQLTQVTTPDTAAPDGATKVTLTSAALINGLNAGTLTRAQVLRAVADSDEVAAVEYNSAFVASQYYGYLRRTPEVSGYQAWLKVINEDPHNVRIMVNGFMNSTEYRLRFGQP